MPLNEAISSSNCSIVEPAKLEISVKMSRTRSTIKKVNDWPLCLVGIRWVQEVSFFGTIRKIWHISNLVISGTIRLPPSIEQGVKTIPK